MAQGNPDFMNSLLMRDAVHFSPLKMSVNKPNCRCGAPEFPRAFHERTAYGEKFVVWGAVGTDSVMGPYLLK
jgi:hypothetical protein